MRLLKKVLVLCLLISCITSSFAIVTAKNDVSTYEMKKGNIDLEKAIKNDYLLIDENEIYAINESVKSNLVELMDNGVTLFFYGSGLSLDEVKDIFGDNFEVEFDEESEKNISAIYVTNVNGMRSYGGIIDCSEHTLTDKNTNEKIKVKDAAIKSSLEVKEHDPLDFLLEMKTDINEAKKNKLKDEADSIIKTQMPASGWDEIVFNWYYDFSPYGEMKSPVYVYSHGQTSGAYYADLITSMTASACDGYAVVGFKSKLYANYDEQELVDWTDLPSKADSISMGLSGDVPGISYSTSTEGVDVDPSISFSSVRAEWECDSRPFYLGQIDGEAFKIELGIRLSSDDTSLKFKRYYQMDIEDVFWGTSYDTDYMYTSTTVTLD